MNERGPYTGHKTIPVQEPSSRVTVEFVTPGHVSVSGTYSVTLPGAEWKQRPLFSDLETDIEQAIRGVLEKYACSCPCHQGGVILHVVPCCESVAAPSSER